MKRLVRFVRSSTGVDWSVVIVVALALGTTAIYVRGSVSPATRVRALGDQVVVTLPRGWVGEELEEEYLAELPSFAEFPPTLSVRSIQVPKEGATPEFIDVQLALLERHRASTGIGFRVLNIEDQKAFGGHTSTWIYYAIVADPPDSEVGDAVIPAVLSGVDILVTTRSGRVYWVAAWDRSESFNSADSQVRSVLSSVVINP